MLDGPLWYRNLARCWTGCIHLPDTASPIHCDGFGRGISREAIVHAVAKRGFRRLLVEGDAYTVSWFLEEGQLDRLHILLVPVSSGGRKGWFAV